MKPNKPKIAIAVSGFPVISQTFIALQIAELYKHGCDMTIVNMGRTEDKSHAPESLRSVQDHLATIALPYDHRAFRNIFRFLLILGTNMLKSPLPSVKLFVHKALRMKFLDFARIHHDAFVFRQCAGFDIIHFQFATLADRFSQVNKYGFVRSSSRLACSIRGYDISLKSNVAGIDWEFLFRHFSLFLPVCHYFVPVLKKMGCKKEIRVIRSPINIDALHRNNNHSGGKTLRILSVGRLVEKKGFDDALRAVSILYQSFADFHYTIIGDGPLYSALESRIHDAALSDKVRLLGEVPPDRTLEIMAGSDILLAPSKTATDGDSEGIPNVIKEAMFLGLQVIATNHAGTPELVEHRVNGFLVSENSPEEIAGILNELIQDRSTWATRSERARSSIYRDYTPEKTTQDLIKAYESIMDPRGMESSGGYGLKKEEI